MSLTPDATALLDRARAVEHAVDLYLAPGTTRLTADRIVEVLRDAAVAELGERALWNLLFSAGELSRRVDVYRAYALFQAAVTAVARVAREIGAPGDPRAAAVEMCFDFFFARPRHPLLPLRAPEIAQGLGRLISDGPRIAQRAAVHGLGHIVAAAEGQAWAAPALEVLDDYLAGRLGPGPDAELARYADEARAGQVR